MSSASQSLSARKRALLLYGGWEGHDPERVADFFEHHHLGEFAVTRSQDLDALATDVLAGFDLLVPIWTFGALTDSQETALLGAVAVDRVRQSWRTVRDALFTARVGLSVLSTAPFLWTALRCAPRGSGAIRVTRNWARVMFALCGVTVDVKGLESLRELSGGLLIANHASYVDPLVLMVALPVELHFVAKRGLVDYPLLGLAITRADHLTIERGDLTRRLEGADELVSRVAADEFVVVFPEGTFQRRRGLLPFRLGAFRAATDAGCPVIPLALQGTRRMLREGQTIPRRGMIRLWVGEPLMSEGESFRDLVALRDRARDIIGAESGEVLRAPWSKARRPGRLRLWL